MLYKLNKHLLNFIIEHSYGQALGTNQFVHLLLPYFHKLALFCYHLFPTMLYKFLRISFPNPLSASDWNCTGSGDRQFKITEGPFGISSLILSLGCLIKVMSHNVRSIRFGV